MKKIIKTKICISPIISVLSGVILTVRYNRLKDYKSKPIKITESFTYTAHTGCMGTEDNSLESIEVGVENGAQIVEFDVRYYKQNPVLAHDEPKGDEVTLKEAFLKVKEYENLKVNVDIKSTEYLQKVQIIAEETGVSDRIFFTGIEESDVDIVKKTCPDVQYYLNVDVLSPRKQSEEYLLSLVEKIKSCGAVGINFNKVKATQELVDIFHENGLLVSIWTVNTGLKMRKILSFAPNNITTRKPDKLSKKVKKYQ